MELNRAYNLIPIYYLFTIYIYLQRSLNFMINCYKICISIFANHNENIVIK